MTQIRILNNSQDHFVDVEEIQVSNDGREAKHVSTYRLRPGEDYVVYAYHYRFFQVKEGPKVDDRSGG